MGTDTKGAPPRPPRPSFLKVAEKRRSVFLSLLLLHMAQEQLSLKQWMRNAFKTRQVPKGRVCAHRRFAQLRSLKEA